MPRIRLLDCTLRDGGYCNNWMFGQNNIHKIINGLLEANLDIIEIGYISQRKRFNIECTQYTSFEQVKRFIPESREGKIFVGMINYGEFNIDDIPLYDGTSVEGIRVTFHKKERKDALEFCSKLKDNIFLFMDEDKKVKYDKKYIEELYTRYLATGKVQEEHMGELEQKLKGKTVVLVAPGKSSEQEKDKIKVATRDAVCISINFNYPLSDFIFLSNLRRYRELAESKRSKCIVTSNITSDQVYLQTKYRDLLNEVDAVRDNAGLKRFHT